MTEVQFFEALSGVMQSAPVIVILLWAWVAERRERLEANRKLIDRAEATQARMDALTVAMTDYLRARGIQTSIDATTQPTVKFTVSDPPAARP